MLCLVSCGGTGTNGGATTVSGFPLTVENCNHQVTIDKPPQRALLITRYSAPLVAAVGALGQVAGKVGLFPADLYTPATKAALDRIPTVSGEEKSSGDVIISLESVLGARSAGCSPEHGTVHGQPSDQRSV